MAVNVLITSNVTHISQLYQQSRSTVIDSSNIHYNNCKTVHSEVAEVVVSRSRIFRRHMAGGFTILICFFSKFQYSLKQKSG